jgi:hypothetical protein
MTIPANAKTGIFKSLRSALLGEGKLSPKCREQGPYSFARNGEKREGEEGKSKRREAGSVAYAIACRALRECLITDRQYWEGYPVAEWSGRWERTRESLEAERQGTDRFWSLVEQLHGKDPMVTECVNAELAKKKFVIYSNDPQREGAFLGIWTRDEPCHISGNPVCWVGYSTDRMIGYTFDAKALEFDRIQEAIKYRADLIRQGWGMLLCRHVGMVPQ